MELQKYFGFLKLMKKSLCLKQPEHIVIQLHSLKVETISALNVRISLETQLEEVEDMEEAPAYADADVVRVSIILQKESTLEAGYSTQGIGENATAMAYRDGLKAE